MLSSEAEFALIILQRRSAQARDIFEIERMDRALDEIVRNPGNTSPAPFQVRSALANASKVLKERRAIVAIGSLDRDLDAATAIPVIRTPGSTKSITSIGSIRPVFRL